jgi:hypothetical protein
MLMLAQSAAHAQVFVLLRLSAFPNHLGHHKKNRGASERRRLLLYPKNKSSLKVKQLVLLSKEASFTNEETSSTKVKQVVLLIKRYFHSEIPLYCDINNKLTSGL